MIWTDRTLLPFGKNAESPEFYVAVSGGIDSIAAAALLFKFHGTSMGICHFNHALRQQNLDMLHGVAGFAGSLGVTFAFGERNEEINQKESLEAELRKARFKFFNSLKSTIVLAHHLDDAVESYFMNFLRGCPEREPIPRKTEIGDSTLVRPFLNTTKEDFKDFACNNDLMRYVVEDETNTDNCFRRNWTRNVMLPQLESHGLRKVVRKKFYT